MRTRLAQRDKLATDGNRANLTALAMVHVMWQNAKTSVWDEVQNGSTLFLETSNFRTARPNISLGWTPPPKKKQLDP